MNNLKFRARNATTGEILNQLYMGQCFQWVNYERQHDIVIEQFTGLKDKQGVEIYQGDHVFACNFLWKVVWEESAGTFLYEMINRDAHEGLDEFEGNCEVVGSKWSKPTVRGLNK